MDRKGNDPRGELLCPGKLCSCLIARTAERGEPMNWRIVQAGLDSRVKEDLTNMVALMGGRVEHDLHYIDNWSIWFDIQIILMTLFSRRSFLNAC